ncbi:MAG: hypothetical protein DMG59_09020 [Acidobacteria bacterium]|nr:MAG: hypothetical protein DMG59_09020 [Acidobacteriota bacterium]
MAEYLVSSAAVGEDLTDQLLLPPALAGKGSFTAQKINLHARTNMAVISGTRLRCRRDCSTMRRDVTNIAEN